MKSILPFIIVILILTGAITYAMSKRTTTKTEESRFGISANKLGAIVTPTPTITPTTTPKPSATPTPSKAVESKIATLPTVTEGGSKGGEKTTPESITKTTKTIVCTPVYGQANTCVEHIVVDTGAEDAIFFNLAGLSYLAGLASFILAKRA